MFKGNQEVPYTSPFDSPRANRKRASFQVNGETQMSQMDIVLKVEAKKQRK